MKIKTLFLFLFLFLTHFQNVQALCFKTNLKFTYLAKPQSEATEVCYYKNKNQINYLTSPSCFQLTCESLKNLPKNIKLQDDLPSYGSIGFKICETVGGVGQIIEYTNNFNQTESTSRCLFKSPDWVENSYLVDRYK